MKRTLFFMACVLASLTMSAQDDLTVGDIQNSGCLRMARGEGAEPLPTIILTMEGSVLSVQLLNYESICGTDDFNVTSTVNDGKDGDPLSISINVVPCIYGDDFPDCLCPYNVSFTVRDVWDKSFYLSCWWYDGPVTLEEGKTLVLEDVKEEATIDGMKYTLRKAMSRAMLSDGSTLEGEVTIPSSLTYEGQTYQVTGISFSAFNNNKNLTKVVIPMTIKSMDLSNNTGISSNPFSGCTALQTIEVEEGNPAVCSVDGVLFNKGKDKLISYPAGAPRTSYTVPESVTWIEGLAFSYSQHLRKVTLTDNVTALGYSAFYESKSVEEVRLSSELKTLASYLFGNCQRLKSVTIPQNVTYLGLKAFENCTSLTSVTMPESITSTDNSVFEGCTSLTSVTLSPNLERIMNHMFTNCSSLKEILIPNGVTMIGSEAFKNCSSLISLDLPKSVNRLGSMAFAGCKLNTLYIRGLIDSRWMDYNLFRDMDTKTNLYVQPSEVEKYKAIYKGPVYPLTESTYLPLVEEGKRWTYDNFLSGRPAKYNHYYYYELKGDTLISGKKCLKMYIENRANNNKIFYYAALYEENKKVYCFDAGKDKAKLLYDFDCKVGDTLHVSEGRMVVKDIRTEDNGGISIRKYILQTVEDNLRVCWIEGVGCILDFFGMLPLPGNYNSLNACELNGEKLYQWIEPDYTAKGYHKMGIEGKQWNYIHYYVDENGEHHDPYSYVVKGDTVISRTTYKKLWYQDEKSERLVCLLREVGREVLKSLDFGDNAYGMPIMTSFFVFSREDFGRVFTWESKVRSGNTNWMVYGVDTINVNNRPFRRYTCLQQYSDEGKELSTIAYDGEGVWHDIWVEGVGSATSGIEDQVPSHEPPMRQPNDYTYFVSCYEDGECIFTAEDFNAQNKPVIDMAYRPFVEEGKVWKVGDVLSGNPVQLVEYYYFDGDTIIGGKTCIKMMCQRYVNPDHAESHFIIQSHSISYVGAWYEEGKKVYVYDSINNQFNLMYDFSVNTNDTVQIRDCLYVVGPKQIGGIKGFKGVYENIRRCEDGTTSYSPTWMESVGSIDGPTKNVYYVDEAPMWFLMSCTVGDEVIYFNDEYEDGATPDAARKKRIDFTHTIKIKPQSRTTRGAEASLYGEYSEQQLGINLNPLDDAYLVRITDESGQAVYEKAVNAVNIVGLNIDISDYAEGRYTVIVENNEESFTAQFDTQTTSILEVRSKRLEVKDGIYNLQGQRISTLQKGVNIVSGRKVFVK